MLPLSTPSPGNFPEIEFHRNEASIHLKEEPRSNLLYKQSARLDFIWNSIQSAREITINNPGDSVDVKNKRDKIVEEVDGNLSKQIDDIVRLNEPAVFSYNFKRKNFHRYFENLYRWIFSMLLISFFFAIHFCLIKISFKS